MKELGFSRFKFGIRHLGYICFLLLAISRTFVEYQNFIMPFLSVIGFSLLIYLMESPNYNIIYYNDETIIIKNRWQPWYSKQLFVKDIQEIKKRFSYSLSGTVRVIAIRVKNNKIHEIQISYLNKKAVDKMIEEINAIIHPAAQVGNTPVAQPSKNAETIPNTLALKVQEIEKNSLQKKSSELIEQALLLPLPADIQKQLRNIQHSYSAAQHMKLYSEKELETITKQKIINVLKQVK